MRKRNQGHVKSILRLGRGLLTEVASKDSQQPCTMVFRQYSREGTEEEEPHDKEALTWHNQVTNGNTKPWLGVPGRPN